MRVLVTGGAGFVGSHVCDDLLLHGHEVVCADIRKTTNIDAALKHDNFTFVQTEIECYDDVCEIMMRVDTVLHLAAIADVGTCIKNPDLAFNVNVMGTYNVLEAARQASVRRVVFASTAAVYGRSDKDLSERDELSPNDMYAASKLAGEHMCMAYGRSYQMSIGILRFFNIFGPRQVGAVIPTFVRRALNDDMLVVNHGGSDVRDFVYIDDVVAVYRKMMLSNKVGPYNIGTGRGVTMAELANMVCEMCGSTVKPKVEGVVPVFSHRLVTQAYTAWEQLKWKHMYTLEAGLHEYVKWVRNQ